MTELVFIDTNVLIYARDLKSAEKREQSRIWLSELAERRIARINLQVLNELARWVLVHEAGRLIGETRAEIDALRKWGDKPLDDSEVDLAWTVRESLGYQWFDCLLIAAAERYGCRFFLTEDMTDRATFRSVMLINPFRASPSEILQQH